MIADLTDKNNHFTIPGFYDDVRELSADERTLLNQKPYNEDKYKSGLGVNALHGEAGYTTTERTGIRPSFDVCGIWGGYQGEGSKTVIPGKAFAKISSHLVPNQSYNKIEALFISYFHAVAPKCVQVKVEPLHGGNAYECPTHLPAYLAAEKACVDVFGKKPVPVRSGGSIPIISQFEELLGIKSILIGFGLESDAIHSPNENFTIENFEKGIETIIRFYLHLQSSNNASPDN